MASPASTIQDDRHSKLVVQIKAARAALRLNSDIDRRIAILKELAASTEELCALMMGR